MIVSWFFFLKIAKLAIRFFGIGFGKNFEIGNWYVNKVIFRFLAYDFRV